MAPELVKLQRMTGITNATYKAEIEGDPQPIIYRKFGESEESTPKIIRSVPLPLRRDSCLRLNVGERRRPEDILLR